LFVSSRSKRTTRCLAVNLHIVNAGGDPGCTTAVGMPSRGAQMASLRWSELHHCFNALSKDRAIPRHSS
jgi:hypothetical protein